MKNNSTTFNLDKKKLRYLLKIGLKSQGTKSTSPEQKKSKLWYDLLSEPLPTDIAHLEILPGVLADFCQTLGLLPGDKLGEHLRNQKTDLSVINNIKQYAKILSCRSRSDEEHIIANTLYYAAIAHALLYHKTKITEFNYEELTVAFDKLREVNWIEKYFAQLFKRAHNYCQKKCI